MRNILLLIIISILNINIGSSQTESEMDSLLNNISKIEKSKRIIKDSSSKKIISYGKESLPILVIFFDDLSETNIYSECNERKLTKGEIAIILSDLIETMPYMVVTGIQNDTLESCFDTPNFIEYYLDYIERDEIEIFQQKYIEWLNSEERVDWIKTTYSSKREYRQAKREANKRKGQ